MVRKFARINFAKSKDMIPVKPELIRKAPERIFDWYIHKFNPYILVEAAISDVQGYDVTLPVLQETAFENIDKTVELMDRTLEILYEMGVFALRLPNGYEEELPMEFFIADGSKVKMLFLNEIIKKCLKNAKTDSKQAEIIIIEGEKKLTEAVIDIIYEELNFLNVILEQSQDEEYEMKAEAVFADCGLNIGFGKRGSGSLKNADIIINLSENQKGYETYYKRSACYIELAKNKVKLHDLLVKRSDIFAVDNINLVMDEKTYFMEEYEMYLYLRLKEFSRLIRGNYAKQTMDVINQHIKADNIKLRIQNPVIGMRRMV